MIKLIATVNGSTLKVKSFKEYPTFKQIMKFKDSVSKSYGSSNFKVEVK